jgi:hypothetical protein
MLRKKSVCRECQHNQYTCSLQQSNQFRPFPGQSIYSALA